MKEGEAMLRPREKYSYSPGKYKENISLLFGKFSCQFVIGLFLLAGCNTTGGNIGQVQSYSSPSIEAPWITNGEPIEFEGELWYPQDGVEALLDSEVYLLGEYKGVQFFGDKVDVRPWNRIYTKFGRNQFRFFEKHKK